MQGRLELGGVPKLFAYPLLHSTTQVISLCVDCRLVDCYELAAFKTQRPSIMTSVTDIPFSQ